MTQNNKENKPILESVLAAMSAAWGDHHHARDQTWKSLQMVAVLAAGLITVDVQFHNWIATLFAGILVLASSYFGVRITLNHRKLEIRKFIHIMNCEEFLGLHRDDLIPLEPKTLKDFGLSSSEYATRASRQNEYEVIRASAVTIPGDISFWDAFRLWKHNTSMFILRMHISVILFTVILIVVRVAEKLGLSLG